MKENYKLFNLDETATDEELLARYNELKEKYREERWQDGEAGNEAARMLTKLDVAYAEIMSARKEQNMNTDGQSAYEQISALIKEDKLSEAQTLLDDCNERPAEWHYLQAVVFYKKNWTNDSKKQLEIAMQMDPDNIKYRNAYGKMNAKNEQTQGQQNAGQAQNPYQNYNGMDGEQMGGDACTSCMECCCFNLCVNCLVNICCCH